MNNPQNKMPTIDEYEIAKFSKMADEWWDPTGKFKPLHIMNPARIKYIKEQISANFPKNTNLDSFPCFNNIKLLDIGCGGGLLCEPLYRLGCTVDGLDPSEKNIKIAKIHSSNQKLAINYINSSVEELADVEINQNKFDVILNMEVIEHVADVELFLNKSSMLLKEGGIMIASTLNRTMKAYLLAIIGAEYILRWLPQGTHDWEKFVTPDELEKGLKLQNLKIIDKKGLIYNPLKGEWSISNNDLDINYMMVSKK